MGLFSKPRCSRGHRIGYCSCQRQINAMAEQTIRRQGYDPRPHACAFSCGGTVRDGICAGNDCPHPNQR